MALLIFIAFCFLLLQSLASTQATSNFAFWLEPGALITKFQASVVVPAISSGSGYHGVWPGIQNDAETFVFQSVIADSNSAGSWEFWVEYCCNSDYQASPIKVYSGDIITSTFSSSNGQEWTDSWSLTPGLTGAASGQTSQGGSSGNTYTGSSIIDKAVLAIELQNGASWDFGQVVWESITLTAATSSAWCSTGYATTGGLAYSISSGSQSVSTTSSTCTYSKMVFL